MQFVFFACASIGLTHILVDSKIGLPVRNLFDKYLPNYISSLIHCYQCTGFWSGLLTGLICLWPMLSCMNWFYAILYLIAAGWAGSFLGNFSAIYFNYLDAQSLINLPDEKKE